MPVDNPKIVGRCCQWMRLALTETEKSPFGIFEDVIEVALGSQGVNDDLIYKSVLYCPFCGTKIPYPEKGAEVLQ